MYGYFSGLCSEIGDCGRSVLNIMVRGTCCSGTCNGGGEHAALWLVELSGFDSW